jgi:hypothetical protein
MNERQETSEPTEALTNKPQPELRSDRSREQRLKAAMQFLALCLEVGSTYDPTRPDHGRASVRNALVGVIAVIAELFPNLPSLPVTLNHLLYALWDLDHGKVPALLQPTKVHNNPGLSLVEDLYRALPSAAMTRMMEGRAMNREDAGRYVARRLTKLGYRDASGDEITGSQIMKWREKMMTERAAENRAAAQYQLALRLVNGMEGREAVEFLMQSMPALYPPNFHKKPPS